MFSRLERMTLLLVLVAGVGAGAHFAPALAARIGGSSEMRTEIENAAQYAGYMLSTGRRGNA